MTPRRPDVHETELANESISHLIKEAIEESRALLKAEVALARAEVKTEVAEAKKAGVGLGIGGVLAVSGLTLLLVALALAISLGALSVLLTGIVVLAAAGVCGVLGYKALPKKPLAETRKRAETDMNLVKEHLA